LGSTESPAVGALLPTYKDQVYGQDRDPQQDGEVTLVQPFPVFKDQIERRELAEEMVADELPQYHGESKPTDSTVNLDLSSGWSNHSGPFAEAVPITDPYEQPHRPGDRQSQDAVENARSEKITQFKLIATILLLMIIVSIVVGTVCVSGSCGNNGGDDSVVVPFITTPELYAAVDAYLLDNTTTSTTALRYGHPIGTWNVTLLTDFSRVFDPVRNNDLSAERTTSISLFNEDISSWDVSNAVSFQGIFAGATSFNQDISSWNVANVVDMSFAFLDCSSFNGDLSRWNTGSVTNMKDMVSRSCEILMAMAL
jgi:surface protein